jgi:uncharacterized protein YjhX (UPF0386 family)
VITQDYLKRAGTRSETPQPRGLCDRIHQIDGVRWTDQGHFLQQKVAVEGLTQRIKAKALVGSGQGVPSRIMDASLLILWLVAGLATAYIAERKGHNPVQWFVFGALLWVVALPWALLMKPEDQDSARA